MKKLTAVEWFFNELERQQYFIGNDIYQSFKQAKEMEKQQIIDSWTDGNDNEAQEVTEYFAEQYYNETFNNK